MKQGGLYDTVDVAVPVPLHLRRTLARGYNQSEMLAAGIARELGIKVERGCLRRVQYNQSQTRYSTRRGVGATSRASSRCGMRTALAGRHVLLVDDVFTTGATIISCGSAIMAAAGDVRLSVATLAVPRKRLGEKP